MKGLCRIAGRCALAATVIAWALPAFGQQQPRGRVQSEQGNEIPVGLRFADIKLGPAYLQPRVGISDIGYDTNVLGSPSTFAVSDFRLTPSAGTRLVIPFRDTHQISGDAQVDYLWYADTKELRTFNFALDARYAYDSERWQADIYTRYIDAQRGQLDVISIGDEIVPPTFEIFGTVREKTLDAGANVRVNVGNRIVVAPRALRRIIRYQDDNEAETVLSETLDRTEESVGGFIGWRLTPKTTIGVDGGYQFNDYETPNNPREADMYLIAGRAEFDDRAPIYGTFVGGYRKLRPTTEAILGFEGFAFDAELAFAPRGIMEITLLGDRDVYPTFWSDSAFYLREGGGLSILFQAQRNLALGADLTYHEHEYPTDATVEQDDGTLFTGRRLDKIYRALGRIEWRHGDAGRVTFRMGWTERDSNFDVAKTDGLVVAGGYGLTF